jgi:hypothetical protein
MHAAFPHFTKEINQVMQHGFKNIEASVLFGRVGGKLLAEGMAVLLKLVFGFIVLKDLPDKSLDFFDKNFVILDPNAEGGKRYYQAKFLIRTRKPEDNMNVLLEFCSDPANLFIGGPAGKVLNPLAVVSTQTPSEKSADEMEKDPDKVDLVICFKDAESIIGLLKRPDVDMVGLLLENLVQLTGNVGHLFKLAAIAANIKQAVNIA